MDNLLRLIRQHNIFGAEPNNASPSPFKDYSFGSVTSKDDSPNENDLDNTYDAGARMRELYQPSHQMGDKYESLLGNMPVRQQPNVWKRIMASAISGATQDPNVGNSVLYAPYERDMRDWTTRLKAVEPAANLERQNNINERAVANSIVSGEESDRRLQRQYSRDKTIERQGDSRLAQGNERIHQGDQRIEQANERLKIATEVSKGGQLKVDDKGNAMIVRKDGSTIPVKGEYLSFEEKEALKAQTAAARTSARRDRVIERIIEDPNNPGKTIRVSINLDTGEATPITVKGATDKATPPKTELETGRGVLNKAQSIKNSNPKWSKWITIDKGKVTIKTPGIFSGPSQEEYQQIYNNVFGNNPSNIPNTGGRGSNPNNNTNTPKSKVRVKRKADGATGMMDANDPQLTSGKYERIQ